MKKFIAIVLSVFLIACVFSGCSAAKRESKNKSTYKQEIQSLGVWSNDVEHAMPQTVVHKLVLNHFNSNLPEGKTEKKAIFIGYDGFRSDGIENVKDYENSAIMYIKSKGGLYHTFSGGVSGVNEQATSTALSWMAMLTGGWSEYNGVADNGVMKKSEAKTFLTALAENGYNVSFTTSWREHTELSYRPDIAAAVKKGLPAEYTHQLDDTATYYQILKYVAKPAGMEKTEREDPDVIFFTLEYTDHAGHSTGFGNQNPEYVEACRDIEDYGYDIIKTIESRSTYANEDWLIIIGTDHGGTKTSHGGQTPFERMTWLASNKAIDITDEYLNYAVK